ncbi:flavin reductase family protein [Bacillus norwichensis]|uniref:Flavin reductase n=1 Tax=Bacillus norwichensis TaxID=2762217 RepID=A0ABR8VIF5_9BACI|nr:flavin reductase family protein [Bacillus norwichensis]MBD8004532.1 flavin reductase [Bacillus norwichensis]
MNEVQEKVTSESFRNAIGHFTSGVSVITSKLDGQDYGITASAVSSVSLDPPMLLVCVNQNAGTCNAISKSRFFTVNILEKNQVETAKRFATPQSDKFQGVDASRTENGLLILNESLVVFECEVAEEITGGTHSVFLGKVKSIKVSKKDPLVYYRGKFGNFLPL